MTEPDPTLEAILEAARKRWPEATSVSVCPPDYYWSEFGGVEISAATLDVRKFDQRGIGEGLYFDHAESVPALLAKLKGEEDAT